MKKTIVEEVVLEKIVYGGQALGKLSSGKKVFVWGGLPGETVKAKIIKNKKSFAEAVVIEVVMQSKNRVEPKDPESYLSTSPWQILDYNYENELKKELIIDQFSQHGVDLKLNNYTAPEEPYYYRNKVEFSFWWNKPEVISSMSRDLLDLSTTTNDSVQDDGGQLDLAFFKRGTHTKQPVTKTSLARPEINTAAMVILEKLRANCIEARDLKTLLIRCNQKGSVVAELYVKDENLQFYESHEDLGIAGFSIHFSNPKSPASVKTKTLYTSGSTQLTDKILEHEYTYAVDGFFQVTIPIYESALKIMKKFIDTKSPLLDMYSGVGSISLSLASTEQLLTLVEVDERCVNEAKSNALKIKPDTKVILASSESATEYITGEETVILDPPRSGLHQKVIDRMLEVKPETIIYLSCNPATQARDISLLTRSYKIKYAHGFNFFPRTPHIENLIILQKINKQV